MKEYLNDKRGQKKQLSAIAVYKGEGHGPLTVQSQVHSRILIASAVWGFGDLWGFFWFMPIALV